jgi:hypothetical protein
MHQKPKEQPATQSTHPSLSNVKNASPCRKPAGPYFGTVPLALAMVFSLSHCHGSGTGGNNGQDGSTNDMSANGDGPNTTGDMPSSTTDGMGVAGVVPPPYEPVCTADNWCYNTPLPQGNDLHSVFTVSATEVWTVGSGGFAWHFTGGKWQTAPTGITQSLNSVWGYVSNAVWAVGANGTILFWNGTMWAPVMSPTTNNLNGVWGSSSTDVWAVGDNGTVLHSSDGVTFKDMTTAAVTAMGGNTNDLNGVYGFSSTNVWIVGAGSNFGTAGTILNYTANGFSASTKVPANGELYGVWGIDAGDIWAVGVNGLLLRNNKGGNSWVQYTSTSQTNATLHAVYGQSTKNILAIGELNTILEWNGTKWGPATNVQSYAQTQYGASGNWIVGAGGRMAFFNNVDWVEYGVSPPLSTNQDMAPQDIGMTMQAPSVPLQNVTALAGSGPTDIWAIDTGNLIHSDGSTWTGVNTGVNAATTPLNALSVLSPTSVWAVGNGGTVVYYNGNKWTSMTTNTTNNLHAVYAFSANEAWAVGDYITLHYLNGTFTSINPNLNAPLRAVFGITPMNVYAAGDNDAIIQWNGTKWSNVSPVMGQFAFHAIWASSATDVWVAGDGGIFQHWIGTMWQEGTLGQSNLLAAYGFSSTDVWLAGQNGVTYHYEGPMTQFRGPQTGYAGSINAIWGASTHDVLAAGGQVILENKN